MKKIIITIAFLLITFVSSSQKLNGKYNYYVDYINFDKEIVEFRITDCGGLIRSF